MAYPTDCQRIRMGGSVSGSTISGGVSIQNLAINFADFNGLLTYPPKRGQNYTAIGADGTRLSNRKPFGESIITLNLRVYPFDEDGMIVATGGREEHLQQNIETLTELIYGSGLDIIIERDVPDGAGGLDTRFIRGEVLTGFQIGEGEARTKKLSVPVKCAYPFWQSETEYSQAITSNTITNNGRAPISNMVIVFPGDGTLTYTNPPDGPHGAPATDEIIEITGSTGAVNVTPGGERGGRAVYASGGASAMGALRVNRPYWMRWDAAHADGDIDLTGTGSPVVYWRDHYFI